MAVDLSMSEKILKKRMIHCNGRKSVRILFLLMIK